MKRILMHLISLGKRLPNTLREAESAGRQSGELAAQLDIDHRDIFLRIHRMNKRMEQEIGENIIKKQGHK